MSRASASGSGSGMGIQVERSLDAAMRAPSATEPEVVVIETVDAVVLGDEEKKRPVVLDPGRDLWISTVDGRHQSPIVPIRVGPNAETFYVHRSVPTKQEYFRKALTGHFSEACSQSIDLPEEDPSIFHFVVAFLYEGTYRPIKPLADVLVAEPEKGKGKDVDDDEIRIVETDTVRDSDSSDSDRTASDDSARSRRLMETRRRRQQRAWEDRNRKEPGRHRPDCTCATCVVDNHAPPCWNCGVPRTRPPPHSSQPPYWYQVGMPPQPQPQPIVLLDAHNGRPIIPPDQARRHRRIHDPPPGPGFAPEPRMSTEDVRAWLATYGLSISVYIVAERYLLRDLRAVVHAYITDALETAGVQAAHPEILTNCKRLFDGVGETDELLKRIFARTGFLLARLWREYPGETQSWWVDSENAEVGARIMREMVERREADEREGGVLPAMERAVMRREGMGSSRGMSEEVVVERQRQRQRIYT